MAFPTRRLARSVALALCILVAAPLSALAADFGSPPATGPITATLPLLGASLKVDVSFDAGGHLSSVGLDPVDGFTATATRPHVVRFESADGATNVTITAWHGNSSISAKASTLADLEGAGTWKADLFDTGAKTTVNYTVGHDADGKPTIAVNSVNAAGGVDATVGTPVSKDRAYGSSASIKVEFERQGFSKTLWLRVFSGKKGDKTAAWLQVTLSARNAQKLEGSLADLVGTHTWHGKLCDGTAIGITFEVVDDGSGNGSVTYDPDTFATGAEAKAWNLKHGNGFIAGFKEARAGVLVWLREKDDTYKLVVGSFAGKWCKGTEVPNPTVNTPVDPKAGEAKGHGGWHWGWRWGWGWGWGWGFWGHGKHHHHHGGGGSDNDGGGKHH